MRRLLIAMAAVVAVVILALFTVVPSLVDRALNRVTPASDTPVVTDATRELHRSLFIADLHADPLLWRRDLLAHARHGHVDIPRLIAGGVALQVFAAPTQVPWGINYDSNELDYDVVTALAITQRWPRATWRSAYARALHMADVLHRTAGASEGRFRIVRSVADLDAFGQDHRARPEQVAGMLAIEGLHALDGRLENVDGLFAAGYRMMGIQHFFDNDLGGSAHGISGGGLTDFGRAAVERMQQLGIVVDVAHSSARTIDDVVAMATAPLVVSHTGVRGTCDTVRNLSDDQVRAIAATGGVIGIGYWDAAICDVDVGGIVRAIRHVIAVAGRDHVGLGSDFDGATTTPFDTSEIVLITQGLVDAGHSPEEVRAIMGGNVQRLLAQTLPRGAS